jgi:pSer/pThr/pTyr-binding forkhead associated (FHA) protein
MPDPSSQKRPKKPPAGAVKGTRLESVAEIRKALKARRTPTLKEITDDDTASYRPLRRPPMALLCVLDDGREEGEWIRLRGDCFIVGREEGDLRIPHDAMMSARHAELSRLVEAGRHRWYLTDLGSTNGTYVRIGAALLRHNQEILIGSRRYRFDAAPQGGPPAPDDKTEPELDETQPKGTRGWDSLSPADLIPCLVELTAKGEGQRYRLEKAENWIGRNAGDCAIVPANDALVSPRHARVYRDGKGRWHVENNNSLNGTWLRIDQMALDAACQFQMGEQRFLLRVL